MPKAEYMFQAPRTEVALVLAGSEALGKQEGKTSATCFLES